MRRWGVIALLALLLPLLAACGGSAGETGTAPTSGAATAVPAADGVDRSRLSDELIFFNWNEYLDPSILEDFEAEYGVRVREEYFLSNEEMIQKIRPGNSGYDLVAPSDYAVQIMIAENLLAPLDKANIPNIQYINSVNMDQYFDPGNVYSLPYMWGVTGIAYNQEYFSERGLEPPDSWSDLFDPVLVEAGGYSGKLSMLDDEREAIGSALVYLGYPINDTTSEHVAAAEALLLNQKPLLRGYNSENALDLVLEEVVIAQAWSGTAAVARLGIEDKPGNEAVQFVIPAEGGTIWQDNLAIVADSPNKYTAEVFINFLHRPEIYARNIDYVLYLSANTAADELLSEETLAVYEAGFRPTPEQIERLQWIERNEATQIFSDIWTRIRSE